MKQDIENIKEQLEEIIKKNLPEKKEMPRNEYGTPYDSNEKGFNQAISQIDTKLIADEVLKVVELEKKRWVFEIKGLMKVSKTEWKALDELLDNLSPNKENKGNSRNQKQ